MLLLLSCEISSYLTQTAGQAPAASGQVEGVRWARKELLKGLAES